MFRVRFGTSTKCMSDALCTSGRTSTRLQRDKGDASLRTKLKCTQAAESHPHVTRSNGANATWPLRFYTATSQLASISGMAGASPLRTLLTSSMVQSRYDLLPKSLVSEQQEDVGLRGGGTRGGSE